MRLLRSIALLACLASLAALPACIVLGDGKSNEAESDDDDDDDDDAGLVAVSTDVCLSGWQWQGGNEESELMHPGMSCISCHAAEGEEEMLFAGTVFQAYGEADDCAGVEGLTVVVTGSDGAIFTMETNRSGNFFLEAEEEEEEDDDDDFAFSGNEEPLPPLVLPYTATVIDGLGGVRTMVAAQAELDCASCHTSTGLNDAPGRIVAP